MNPSVKSYSRFLLTGIFLLGVFLLYSYRLDFPPTEYFDEVHHVTGARQFVTHSGVYKNTHPPLVKWMMMFSIERLGDWSAAWRVPSLLGGILAVYFFFLLAQRILGDYDFALLAAFLFAFDGLVITQARIGMLNSVMLSFMLGALWFWIQALDHPEKEGRYFFLSSLCLGLAAGSRWIGVGIIAAMDLYLVVIASPLPKAGAKQSGFINQIASSHKSLLAMTVLYAVISIAIYFLSHAILLEIRGYGTWKSILNYQKHMLDYHKMLTSGHNYGSSWWGWPAMIRPIWYFYSQKGGVVYGILSICNPAVIWALFPALGFLLWKWFQSRDKTIAFLFLAFLSQWLPWMLIGRVKFFHYFYTAFPFLVLMVVYYLREIWEAGK